MKKVIKFRNEGQMKEYFPENDVFADSGISVEKIVMSDIADAITVNIEIPESDKDRVDEHILSTGIIIGMNMMKNAFLHEVKERR